MGVHGDGDNKKKGKGRGAANVGARLAGLGSGSGKITSADWNEADPQFVLGIIVETTRLGGMVSFSLTRDGGAWVVTVLLDGDRRPVYVSSGSDDLNAELEKIVHYLASVPR